MRHPRPAAALALLLLAPLPAAAQGDARGDARNGAAPPAAPPASGTVAVTDAWARASIGASTTAAAYLTLTDRGMPDRLVGASTPVAATAQLHTAGMEGGVMHMRPVEALLLPSGTPVTLAPGGYHLMLEHLSHPLHRGDSFPLTLTFAHASPVTVQVRVEGPGATHPDAMPGMTMDRSAGTPAAGARRP